MACTLAGDFPPNKVINMPDVQIFALIKKIAMVYVRKCAYINYVYIVWAWCSWAYLTGNTYGHFVLVHIARISTSGAYLPSIINFHIEYGDFDL